MSFPDIVGLIGVVLIILAFLLLQIEKCSAFSMTYLLLNLSGSACLLYSLFYNWNMASVVIECLWLFISIYGIIRHNFLKSKNNIL